MYSQTAIRENVYQPLTLCPSPLTKGRGKRFKRGASPLSSLHSPFPYQEGGILPEIVPKTICCVRGLMPFKRKLFINPSPFVPLPLQRGEGRDLREGLRPSLIYTPPSLIKGRGAGG